MTLEEKLANFDSLCQRHATDRTRRLLSDREQALQERFARHQETARRRAELEIQTERETLKREANKRYSLRRTELQRQVEALRRDRKERIFSELENRLASFCESPDYQRLLEKQIDEARKLAGSDPLYIYLDPSDERLLKILELRSGLQLYLASHSFLGGLKAEIPSRNILIDYSFETKLFDAAQAFAFCLRERGQKES